MKSIKLFVSLIFNYNLLYMRKTLPHRVDEFQAYINPIFQPFGEEEDDYGNSDSPPASPRDLIFSQVEVVSSDTIVMPVMVLEAANFW